MIGLGSAAVSSLKGISLSFLSLPSHFCLPGRSLQYEVLEIETSSILGVTFSYSYAKGAVMTYLLTVLSSFALCNASPFHND